MQLSEFKRRRRQLMTMMGAGSVAILPTSVEAVRNRDVHHPYRPDSDFYYLTGFAEPEAVMVLVPGRTHGEYILFCREKDPAKELWDGSRVGLDGAVAQYGADDAFPISDLDDILPGLLEERERVFFAMGSDPALDKRVSDWVSQVRSRARAGVHGPIEFLALDHYLHDMRLYKSRAEVTVMRRAARLAAQAHTELMRRVEPGMYEYQLGAIFSHHCQMAGASQLAYPSIVGGGNNACVLHYIENSQPLNDGDLVLVDAGCELECYASDITRTYPVNGRFSEPQRILYELVLEAQAAAIDKARVGNHWNDPHEAAVRVLTKGLLKLGLLRGTLAKALKAKSYSRFYMHRTGHWLGMDVHDVGDYKVDGHWRLLEKGMVLTVEPGLYIPQGTKGIAKKWQGIGIRIEDDVLVTDGEPDVLSRDVPKSVELIESVMAK
ncbi:MAG: aminopeptidase P N-terminal domain-containing protein [Chromatiaceae bacterium]|nr:aminopeptidase P N-terminal domain-containing protein [Chromatiaceae bacterium]MCP5431057.1 aminopeptidase P N-terminal domain-containing protein [Chromatiaceae bacterium]MCP5433859.1 aminopeptidase P N-terminal domain-containing protein [Chromatiaceae bacterium]MCP5438165.1 aminopeptidase P N-terminal domain-containing protein [Chromatiaceae bacterium]